MMNDGKKKINAFFYLLSYTGKKNKIKEIILT